MKREDIDNRLSAIQDYIDKIHELESVVYCLLDGMNEDCSNNFIHPLKSVPSIIYKFVNDSKYGLTFVEFYFSGYVSDRDLDSSNQLIDGSYYLYQALDEKSNKLYMTGFEEDDFGKSYHYDKSKLFKQLYEVFQKDSVYNFEQNDKMVVDSCLTTVGKEGEDVRKLSNEFGYKMKFCKFWYNRLDNDYEAAFDKLKLFKENGVSK